MTIETELTRLENAKAAIISTLESKNVEVPSGTKIQGLTALIATLPDKPVPVTPEWGAIEYYPTSSITLPGKFSMFDMMTMEEIEVNIANPSALAQTIIENNIMSSNILYGGSEEQYGFQNHQYEGGWFDTYNFSGPYTTEQLGLENRQYNDYDEIHFKNNSGHWSATGSTVRIELANQSQWETFLNAAPNESITIQGKTFKKGAVARVEFGTNCTTVGDDKLACLAMLKSIGHEENLTSVGKNFLNNVFVFDNGGKDLTFQNLASVSTHFQDASFSFTNFGKKVEFGSSCTSIFKFQSCGSGITVVIPASVTSIRGILQGNNGGATVIDRSNAPLNVTDYEKSVCVRSTSTTDKDFIMKGSGRQKWLTAYSAQFTTRNIIDGGAE